MSGAGRSVSGRLTLAALVVLVVGSSLASAQSTRDSVAASLEYSREAGAESCPDEGAIEASVQRQLGSAVFEREPATRVANVVVRRAQGRFVARLALRSATGEGQGSREIESASDTCDELSEALSLALALALDPGPVAYVTEPVPEAPSAEVAEPVAAVVAPVVPNVVEPEPSPPTQPTQPTSSRWEVGLGLALGSGLLPEPGITGLLTAGLRFSHLALVLEAAATLEASTTLDTTTLETRSEFARLGACAFFFGDAPIDVGACGLGTLGVLHAESPMATDRSTSLLAAVGGRIAGRAHLLGPMSFEVRGDLHTNLARTEFSFSGDTLWRSPLLFGEISLVWVVRFL